jgi:hypothetical protein
VLPTLSTPVSSEHLTRNHQQCHLKMILSVGEFAEEKHPSLLPPICHYFNNVGLVCVCVEHCDFTDRSVTM